MVTDSSGNSNRHDYKTTPDGSVANSGSTAVNSGYILTVHTKAKRAFHSVHGMQSSTMVSLLRSHKNGLPCHAQNAARLSEPQTADKSASCLQSRMLQLQN